MEKMNRKKLAKVALLSASLTMGFTLAQTIFNEAHASGTKSLVYVGKPGGGSTTECIAGNSNC